MVCDKETVFYQDPSVNAALGICVLGNKSSCPIPRTSSFDRYRWGWKSRQAGTLVHWHRRQRPRSWRHAFVFGPDGKLYFNMGTKGKHLFYPLTRDCRCMGRSTSGDETSGGSGWQRGQYLGTPYRMGMVFRCNLDGSAVETLAWNFRNNYEGRGLLRHALQSDNDDDGNRGPN